MTKMIAKFQVTKVTPLPHVGEQLDFMAVSNKPFDPDGKSDDNSFARWTPSGQLSMTLQNPDLLGKFTVGQKFYLTFQEETIEQL
jgi:hypothetical protein